MSDFIAVSQESHDALVAALYRSRGYSENESAEGAKLSSKASRYGIRTHNALKALHLDHLFGSVVGGCVPGAEIDVLSSRFASSEMWNANRKLGQSVAFRAIHRCMELADQYGIGQVAVDNTFHYLWGGGYVLEAANKGYIAYTNCTSTLAEVVPPNGKFPTLGTNPHSWAFPTTEAIGFPLLIDWATSVVAMGRVQSLAREGKSLPEGAAVDKDGNPTTDPNKVAALLPFGAHKGYSMCLLNELYGGLIGGSLPTLRGRKEKAPEGEKTTTTFYFQVIHPDALSGGDFAMGRSQKDNIKAVLEDIRSHGNEDCIFPGQFEEQARQRSEEAGGLLFTEAEVKEFDELAAEISAPGLERI